MRKFILSFLLIVLPVWLFAAGKEFYLELPDGSGVWTNKSILKYIYDEYGNEICEHWNGSEDHDCQCKSNIIYNSDNKIIQYDDMYTRYYITRDKTGRIIKIEKKDLITLGDKYAYSPENITYYNYNSNNLLNTKSWFYNGKCERKYVYKYDKNNRVIEEITYRKEERDERTLYSYHDKTEERIIYDKNDKELIRWVFTCIYEDKQQKIYKRLHYYKTEWDSTCYVISTYKDGLCIEYDECIAK